jgi:hypothetical protein
MHKHGFSKVVLGLTLTALACGALFDGTALA